MTVDEFTAEAEAHSRRAGKEGFARWLAQSEIKLLIGFLPPLESDHQKEIFKGLLESCFTAGLGMGQSVVAASLIRAIMEAKESREK